MISIFLTPEVFKWHSVLISHKHIQRQHQFRLYEIWNYAKLIAESSTTKDERGNCITNLNKIIDLRVKELNKIYGLSKFLKRLKQFDRLMQLGIIRYHLLQKIDRIRNLYLHKDDDPPEKSELLDLIEFVWYFLKATDTFASKRSILVQLNPTGLIDDFPYFEMRIGPEDNPSLLTYFHGEKKYLTLNDNMYSWIELVCMEDNFRMFEDSDVIKFQKAELKDRTYLLDFLKKFFEGI